jgi:hypothetical protein
MKLYGFYSHKYQTTRSSYYLKYLKNNTVELQRKEGDFIACNVGNAFQISAETLLLSGSKWFIFLRFNKLTNDKKKQRNSSTN